MGLKDFIEKISLKMKQNFQKHIPVGFIIQPIIHYQIRDKAYHKIDRMQHPCCRHGLLIRALYKAQGHVPNSPYYSKNNTGY
jgi:hypothetical protein